MQYSSVFLEENISEQQFRLNIICKEGRREDRLHEIHDYYTSFIVITVHCLYI